MQDIYLLQYTIDIGAARRGWSNPFLPLPQLTSLPWSSYFYPPLCQESTRIYQVTNCSQWADFTPDRASPRASQFRSVSWHSAQYRKFVTLVSLVALRSAVRILPKGHQISTTRRRSTEVPVTWVTSRYVQYELIFCKVYKLLVHGRSTGGLRHTSLPDVNNSCATYCCFTSCYSKFWRWKMCIYQTLLK